MSRLLVIDDGKRERELQLVDRLVIGRDPACDVSHEHSLLSRRHAEFVAGRDQVIVRDLGSRNGIFVNGTRAAELALHPGDVVQIGPLRVQFVLREAPVGVVADDVDSDGTIVSLLPARPVAPRPPPAAPVEPPKDDETRLFSPPVPSQTPDPAPSPDAAGASADDDDHPTMHTAPPSASAASPAAVPRSGGPDTPAEPPGTVLTPPPSVSMPPRPPGTPPAPPVAARLPVSSPAPVAASAAVAPRFSERALAGFVFVQTAVLAGIILVAVAGPLLLSGGDALRAGGVGLAAPLLIAVLVAAGATYAVGTAINGRIARTLREVGESREDGTRDSHLDAIGRYGA